MAVNATAVWRVRPSGSNTNGGGYDPGIAGAATDYSQQNAAQASGSAGTASGTTTFSDTVAAAFTSAMIGNAIWIASGAGFTTGAYFVTAFTSSTTVTLDRSPGTGSAAVWKLGGGWANFWTNTQASPPIMPGNTIYILGSGTPNPASYTVDYSMNAAPALISGDTTSGKVTFANDPLTPGYKAPPDTTGGMPTIKPVTGNYIAGTSDFIFSGLWFIAPADNDIIFNSIDNSFIFGCVFDQFGKDAFLVSNVTSTIVMGCEVYSSVGASGSNFVITTFGNCSTIGCNIHDCVGGAVICETRCSVSGTIIAKCVGDGIKFAGSGAPQRIISNNTIDGNGGNGILVPTQGLLRGVICINNIISNHTVGGKFGIAVSTGTATQNSKLGFVDYNVYYNNSSNYNAISAGTHDTALGSSPYVASSTENYALA